MRHRKERPLERDSNSNASRTLIDPYRGFCVLVILCDFNTEGRLVQVPVGFRRLHESRGHLGEDRGENTTDVFLWESQRQIRRNYGF